MENHEIKTLENSINKWVKWFMILSIPLFIFIYYFLPKYIIKIVDFGFGHTENQLAPDINAVVGPIIAYLGVIITFFAFYSQFRANVIQMNNFTHSLKQSSTQFQLSQFESKFFTLIKLHKENIAELEIESIKKRKCFQLFCSEFQEIYSIVKDEFIKLETTKLTEIKIHQIKADISFTILMFGIDNETTAQLIKGILTNRYRYTISDSDQFIIKVISILTKKSHDIDNYETDKFRNFPFLSNQIFSEIHNSAYRPFKGHQFRLSHYYRHLFQTVKFVEEHNELSEELKKHYIRFLKAQLGIYELSLFFFNSLSSMGRGWREFIDKNSKEQIDLISKYEMIKNLPPKYFTGTLNPKEFYNSFDYEWEWIIA